MNEKANWYDEIIANPVIKDVEKVPQEDLSIEEPKIEKKIDTSWYDELISDTLVSVEEPREYFPKQEIDPEADLAFQETLKHAGIGLATFFPAVASGLGEMIRGKGKNILAAAMKGPHPGDKQAFDKKLSAAKNIPEWQEIYEREQVRKASRELTLDQMYSNPQEIRDKVADAMSIWTDWMEPPKTQKAKDNLKLIDITHNDIIFHYPHQLDKKMSDAGYPNAGWIMGVIGELTALHMIKSAGKEVKGLPKKFNVLLKKTDAEIKSGLMTERTVGKIEKSLSDYADELGVSEKDIASPETARAYMDKTYRKPEGDALKRASNAQKKKGHALARELKLTEIERRNLAEEITGERSMKEMSKESAGKFIDRLKERIKEYRLEKPVIKSVTEPDIKILEFEKLDESIKLTESEKPIAKIEAPAVKEPISPSVQKTNVVIPEDLKPIISDGISISQDMGIYADIKRMVGEKKKVGEILKEVKKGEFYKSDLKEFDYGETEIRDTIRAIKAEGGDQKAIKYIQERIKQDKLDVEKAKERTRVREEKQKAEKPVVEKSVVEKKIEEPKPEPNIVSELIKKSEKEQLVLAEEDLTILEPSSKPIRGDDPGKSILKSKTAAKIILIRRGIEGEIIKNPEGDGWIVEKIKTKEQIAKERRLEEKEWEDIRDAELKELEDADYEGLGERSEIDIENLSIFDSLTNERGAINITPEAIKKFKDLIKRKRFTQNQVEAELKLRGATTKEISEIFKPVSVQKLNKGESEFLKKDQDPKELLPARKIKKNKNAPAITREDAHIVAITTDLPTAQGSGLKKAIIGEKVRIATSEGIFTQLGDPIRNIFYKRRRASQKVSKDYQVELLKESRKLNKMFKLGSRELHSKRLAIYEIAQQENGIARLKAQGITNIPKLTKKEQFVYKERQKSYKNLYEEVNSIREKTGQDKFPPVENYSMWAHDMSKLSDIEKISMFDDLKTVQEGLDRIRDIPSQMDKLGRTISLKGHEKLRAGPDMPGHLILDSFENYNVYASMASKAIHESYDIAYMHELLRPKYGLKENAPNTHSFISNWLDYQKGHEPIMFIENFKTRRFLGSLSNNVAVAYLSYALRSALVQLASINASYSSLGERFLAEGIARFLNPFEIKRAKKESNVINVRTPEAVLQDAYRTRQFFPGLKGKSIAKGYEKIKKAGFAGFNITDPTIAYITWLSGEAKGRYLYKKLTPEAKKAISIKDFTREYADDVLERCQGSASISARSPIQQHAEGKFLTTLGTFTIAHFDFLKRHVAGINNPKMTNAQRFAAISRYVIASTLISSLFEDKLDVHSPIPTPVRAWIETLENDNTDDATKNAVIAAAKEFIEFIPIAGSKFKFDTELTGAITEQFINLAQGDFSAIGRLMGLPGFQALWKAYRAYKQDGTAMDMILGRYLEPPRKQKGLTAPLGGHGKDSIRRNIKH